MSKTADNIFHVKTDGFYGESNDYRWRDYILRYEKTMMEKKR